MQDDPCSPAFCTALSCQVSCRYPRMHAFRRWNPAPTPSSLAHCNQLSPNSSPPTVWLFLLSSSLSFTLYFASLSSCCVVYLCSPFPVFFFFFAQLLLPRLIFLPASTSSPVMLCCRGHLLCPSLFMIPAQKDTSMKYSPAQLAVKWFTQACLSCVRVTRTHCSHVCTGLI